MFPKKFLFKHLTYSLNVLFILTFIIHVSFLVNDLAYPEYPEVHVFKNKLENIEFPLAFRLCLNEDSLKRKDRYKKFGYAWEGSFFRGESMYNSSNIGWGGHTENGSTIAPVEGLLINDYDL